MLLVYSALFLILGLALLWLSNRQRDHLGLPEGKLIYSDTGAERRVLDPLYEGELQLVGRPDYLVESPEGLVPVEMKTGRSPDQPYASHIYQLAAYCLLVARNFKHRPPYGIIRYPLRSFRVDFTRELENKVLNLLAEMRRSYELTELHRSHRALGRCRACGYGPVCDERLVENNLLL